ncbi:CoA transferase subunit A [Achromobacter aloeverae]
MKAPNAGHRGRRSFTGRRAFPLPGGKMAQTASSTSVDDIAARIPDGCRLAMPADYAGVSMAMVPALLHSAPRHLALIGVPTGGLAFDILIGAGMVTSVETSAISLGEAGGAPCFMRAIATGSIRIQDSTCPAVHAGLMAAQKGAPFTTLRGLIGTDVLQHRSDWRVMQNPFSEAPDPVVAIPALHPDVSLFHAPMADRDGNVWIGRRRELAAMAYASKQTYVTVERIVDRDFMEDELTAAGVLPALYVDGIARAEKGARPYGLWGEYGADTAQLLRYAQMAKTEQGFTQWIEEAFQ